MLIPISHAQQDVGLARWLQQAAAFGTMCYGLVLKGAAAIQPLANESCCVDGAIGTTSMFAGLLCALHVCSSSCSVGLSAAGDSSAAQQYALALVVCCCSDCYCRNIPSYSFFATTGPMCATCVQGRSSAAVQHS